MTELTNGKNGVASTTKKEQESAVVKAAKKILKKHSKSELKLKNLVQETCHKIEQEHPTVSSNLVKEWIQKSSKFQIQGKKISLKDKKRKDNGDHSGADSDLPRSPNKRSKTDNKVSTIPSSSSSSPDTNAIAAWRREQKIVLVRSTVEATEETRRDGSFFPFCSFDDCRDTIAPSLVQQCTKGNGFTKPSPIQAQAWPILTKAHDVVGIAEVRNVSNNCKLLVSS